MDEDEGHALLMTRALSRCTPPWNVFWVPTLGLARASLRNDLPKVVVTDVVLPDGSGAELLAECHGQCPVVVLTSQGNERAAVEVMRSGAVDYVVKSSSTLGEMPHIVERALRTWDHICQKAAAEERLRLAHRELQELVQERTRELSMSRERYWELVTTANAIVVRWDERGDFHFMNPFGLKFFRVTAELLFGCSISEITFPEWSQSKAWLQDVLRSILNENSGTRNAVRSIERDDGSVVWVAWTSNILTNTTNGLREILSIGIDVTEQKKLQQELAAAKETAEAANRAKTDFLANMSHEIRTPMNAVLGMTHLALQATRDPKLSGYLHKAEDAAKSLLHILNDILDFTKIEAGRLELEISSFTPDMILDRVRTLMDLRATERGVQLECYVAPDVPKRLVGDPYRLGQVLLNLVGNAVKFTEQGRVQISIALERSEESQVWIHFAVQDTGIGMDADQQQRLFKPFQQAENSTTRRFGGTGLGLSISQRLAHLMGGDISVQSEPGIGSTFSFSLPLSLEICNENTVSSIIYEPISLEGKCILVVEDDPVNREVVRTILENAQAQVVAVENGEDALTSAWSQTFQVILMDCVLPTLSGYQATERLRADLRTAHIPIIAMTANAMPEDRAKSSLAGMNEYLAKPFEADELLRVVSRFANGNGHAPEQEIQDSQPDIIIHVSSEGAESILLGAGFAVESAIRRLSGEWSIYRHMLSGFCRNQATIPSDIARLLETGDFIQTRRLCHSLKGLAAFVGATRVMQLAKAMEEEPVDSKLREKLKDLQIEMEFVVHAALDYLEHTSEPQMVEPEGEFDLGVFREQLIASDSDAVEQASLFAHLHKGGPDDLPRQVELRALRYDFQGALDCLDEWIVKNKEYFRAANNSRRG